MATRAKKAPQVQEVGFNDLLKVTRQSLAEIENDIKDIRESLSKAEHREREVATRYNYLRKVKYQATYTGEAERHVWHMREQGASAYIKSAWKEIYTFNTVEYEFTIVLSERTDLKKMKWEVKVSGTSITPANKLYNGSEYRNHGYIKGKYEGEELEVKFPSEEAARAFVELWKGRLIQDHQAEINAEYVLLQQAKAMPRIQVGSIVEHNYYGRGKVTEKSSSHRFYVLFDRAVEHLGDKAESMLCDEDNLELITE